MNDNKINKKLRNVAPTSTSSTSMEQLQKNGESGSDV
jgi:hypothetical protein